jgi:hypothetical protein
MKGGHTGKKHPEQSKSFNKKRDRRAERDKDREIH